MEAIKYRTIDRKDYQIVSQIINQSFGLFHYVGEKSALECFKTQYIYGCLAEATYTCVAEKDGKVIGVIMGHSNNVSRSILHLLYGIKTVFYNLKMMYFCRKSKSEISDYKNLHEIYYKFFQKHKGEFDGVLTLFAIDENYRGLGVGKTLLAGLLDFLYKHNTKKIYLYTDSTCNYGFYEHEGFKCLERQELYLTRDNAPYKMDVFLYSYELSCEMEKLSFEGEKI